MQQYSYAFIQKFELIFLGFATKWGRNRLLNISEEIYTIVIINLSFQLSVIDFIVDRTKHWILIFFEKEKHYVKFKMVYLIKQQLKIKLSWLGHH